MKKLLVLTYGALFCLSANIYADQEVRNDVPQEVEETEEGKTKEASLKLSFSGDENRHAVPDGATEDQEEEVEGVTKQASLMVKNFQQWYQSSYQNNSLYTGSYHWPVELTVAGDFLTLEDGSQWRISSDNIWMVLGWRQADQVFICRNQQYNPPYKYLLWNATNGQAVAAKLCLTPYINGQYTHYYAERTNSDQVFVLEDGSCWVLYDNDELFWRPLAVGMKLDGWHKGDIIMVGLNNDPADKDRRPYLLVNASKNESMTANLLR